MGIIKKTTTTSLRLSPDTLANWRRQAEAADLTLSDWLRAKVDASEMTWLPSPNTAQSKSEFVGVNPDLMRQLGHIGNNLNQIARALNTAKKIGSPVNLAQTLVLICAIEQKISTVLADLPKSPSINRSADSVERAKLRYAKKRENQLKKTMARKVNAD